MCVSWVFFRKQLHGTEFEYQICGIRSLSPTSSPGSSAWKCPCDIFPPAGRDTGGSQFLLLAVLPETSYTISHPTASLQMSGPHSMLLCRYAAYLILSSTWHQVELRLGLRSLIYQGNSLMNRVFTTQVWVSHVKHKSPFVLEVTAASSRRNFPQDYLVLIHTLEYFEKN